MGLPLVSCFLWQVAIAPLPVILRKRSAPYLVILRKRSAVAESTATV